MNQDDDLWGDASMDQRDRALVIAQVDAFMTILAKRYGVSVNEIADTVRWVKEHREYLDAMKRAGMIALISSLVGAFLLALWEGIKSGLGRQP